MTLPVVVISTLVLGGVVAVEFSGAPASAAATTGTFTIGTTPVDLNQAPDPGIGSLTPSADAAQNGMFGPQSDWPVVPLEAAVARNGQLVTWGTPMWAPSQGGWTYDVWDPNSGLASGSHTDYASENSYDSFCNAFTELPDGRMLMLGGNSSVMSMIFDPTTGAQTMGQNINHQRWYGSALRLVDGRVLVMGGADSYNSNAYLNPTATSGVAETPEIGTGTGAWTDLTGATSDTAFGVQDNRWWYPRAFNGPDGSVVGTSADQLWTLSTVNGGSVRPLGSLPWNPGVSGSQVMYAPGHELIAGGGQITNDDDLPGSSRAAVIDWSGATPTVTSTADMPEPANWLNLTVLPTGEVLADGGTKVGNVGHDVSNAVRQASIWNPSTGLWRTAATAARTRSYHSTAALLPSGAVFTGGGGLPGPETNFNAELYYPAYLFTTAADGSVQWASRPAITSIAGSATAGGTVSLTIADGRRIASASLISLPAVTHAQNTDQRRVPLVVSQQGGTVSATLPTSLNTMPPGDYELTVVDANGVPSTAQIVTIRAGEAGLVTVAPGTTAANGTAASTTPTAASASASASASGESTPTAGASTPTADPAPSSGTTAGHVAQPSLAVKLPVGRVISIAPGARTTYRLVHTGTTVSLAKVGTRSRPTLRRAASFTIRRGLGSSGGYSFESVDKRGWYLAAPSGSGRLVLMKRSTSASMRHRATFFSMVGLLRHDISMKTSSSTLRYVRTDGSRVIAAPTPGSTSGRMSATFIFAKGLAAR